MSRAQLWIYFLRLGATGFGGPLAIIALIQKDLIEERHLLPEDEFQQSLALIKSMPGPVAVQLVAYVGYRLLGVVGAIVSVISFVLPAALMLTLLAIYYSSFQASPFLVGMLAGMQGAALVLIATSLQPLTKSYVRKPLFWVFAAVGLILLFKVQLAEPVVIFALGLAAIFILRPRPQRTLKSWALLDLFLVCAKAGGVAFGTGIAIIPMLQTDFVTQHNWVTNREFLDALAFGQMTPGPVSVTVTFVGYRLAGWVGAVVATVGIFTPGVFNMTTWFPRANNWMSRQRWIHDFVLGAIAAISAGIVLAVVQLGEDLKWQQLVVPVLMFVFGLKLKYPTWLLVIGSGLAWAVLAPLLAL